MELTREQQQALAMAAARLRLQEQEAAYQQPAPPPGVMIHEKGRSFVTGEGGKPAFTAPVSPATDRNLTSEALRVRADSPTASGVAAAVSPFGQGVGASWTDEVVSGLYGAGRAATGQGSFTDNYNYAQEVQRQDLDAARTAAPWLSAGSQVAGALTQAPALAAALPKMAGMSLLGQAAVGAGSGAALGAVDGAGAGSGLEGRGQGAATGAIVGGVVGGAVPLIAGAVGSLANKVLDGRTVDKNLKAVGLDRAAGDQVQRVMGADDAFSGAGARNIDAAGPNAMLVDAGPSARGMLDTAMQRGGPAALTGRQAVVERATTAERNLTSVMDTVLGTPEGIQTATTAIRQGGAPVREMAYDLAYAQPIDYASGGGRALEALLKRVPGGVLKTAQQLMQVDGVQSRQILANVADDGTVTFARLPDVRQFDYITRALKHAAESGEGQGALGGQTQMGSAYERLASTIRSTLKRAVPEYGAALETAADDISRVQALKLGRDVLNPQVARDVLAAKAKDMTGPEKEAVRQGLRSQIDELLANVKQAASDPNIEAREVTAAWKMMSSRAFREKAAMFMEPKDAHQLFSELGRAQKALELYAGVARNSATFGRTATADAVKASREPGALGLAMEARPWQSLQRAQQFLTGRTPQDKLAAEDAIYGQIATALTTQRGPQAARAMQALTDAYQAGAANRSTSEAIGAGLGAGSGLSLYQLGQQYLDRRR